MLGQIPLEENSQDSLFESSVDISGNDRKPFIVTSMFQEKEDKKPPKFKVGGGLIPNIDINKHSTMTSSAWRKKYDISQVHNIEKSLKLTSSR